MNTSRLPYSFMQHQQGTTLIEVLIAIVVLAIGLLGTAALQTRAQQAELESYQRSQALILAQDMLNRISSNRGAARCYDTMDGDENYVGTGFTYDPAVDACSGWGTVETRARADADIQEWSDLLAGSAETLDGTRVGSMTGARGCVRYVGTDSAGNDVDWYLVSVAWQGQTSTQAPGNDIDGTPNVCAQTTGGNLTYGDDTQRRVITLDLRLGKLD